jgi:hypothetical protein
MTGVALLPTRGVVVGLRREPVVRKSDEADRWLAAAGVLGL